MKRFIIICLTALTMLSCTKNGDDDTGNDTPKKYDKITIDNTYIRMQAYSDPVTFTFNSTADWELEIIGSEPDWITIEPKSGKAGDAEIILTPQFNLYKEGRGVEFIITAKKAYAPPISAIQLPIAQSLDDILDATYSSTDFSKDGEVYTLQKANIKGSEGINIVFMGDGFSDRLIADGTYKKIMEFSMEAFFSIEPYKSFRDFFNCYYVNVVSEDEVVCEGNNTTFKTTLDTNYNSTVIDGDNAIVIEYARKALSEDVDMDDVLAAVAVNSLTHHGTCHWFTPENYALGAGDGFTIAYSAFGTYRSTLLHECGHGLAKLADEYVLDPQINQQLPESQIFLYNNYYKPLGWYKNIDVTDNPEEISWNHFLSDARYEKDKVGIFEGAWYYGHGVYRPSYDSMMRKSGNGYEFNAPSREAIYYRIHKIAYGDEWEYDYEKFVEYDTKNIGKLPAAIEGKSTYAAKPHSNPIIHNCSWRQTLNGNSGDNEKQEIIINDKL